jgi:hypothetical protein
MDPNRRIQELEKQVERLTGLVGELLSKDDRRDEDERKTGARSKPILKPEAASALVPQVIRDPGPLANRMRERVEHALGGEEGESLESRIGSVWLSRLAVVAVMSALALGASLTFKDDTIGPVQKVAIGYGIAAIFSIYGLIAGRRRDFFAEAMLGCGLATYYFTTYAALFVDETRLGWAFLDATGLRTTLVLISLLVLSGVAHWRRSQTVAGIGLFLAYYTVVVSCTQAPSLENLWHALLTCAVLSVVTLIFHAAHRWLLFSWVALIATHVTFLLFFREKPEGLPISDTDYFWISNGFLSLSFVLFSLTSVVDARKTGEYRRTVAPMSGLNSAFFLVVTYLAIRNHYPEEQWMFRLGVGLLFSVFAVLAQTTGPKRNYLFQIYIAKAVILFTLCLQAALAENGEILLVAMSIECLALGFSYKRSSIVAFKVLGLCLMAITFAGCLLSVKMSGAVPLGNFFFPANWFSAVGVAVVFQIVAWFYEKFVRRLSPGNRVTSGQWFMADTPLDLRSATMAMLHAAAGAMILLTITIVEQSDDVALPFFLGGIGVSLTGLGLLLLTPQTETAGVLLGAAAHLCYYVFLWMPKEAFQRQPFFVEYTVALALFTYVGAYAWERYLRRYRHAEDDWEHHLVAAVPYLAATCLLTILMARQLPDVHSAWSQSALGAGLLLFGVITRYPGIRASGVLALGSGSACLYVLMTNPEAPLGQADYFLPTLALYLIMLVLAERFLAILQHYEEQPSLLESGVRTVFAVLIVVLGAFGLFEWAAAKDAAKDLSLMLLALAVFLIVLGVIFRESRYRWGAITLFAVIAIRAFTHFGDSPPLYQVLTFTASAVVLLTVSWGYSRMGRRHKARREAAKGEEQAEKHG